MIDTKAIREVAICTSDSERMQFKPSSVIALMDRLEAAEAEVLEQARLLGIGGEKELALMAKLEAAEKEIQLARDEALDEASKTLEGDEFIQDGITYRETKHAGSWQVKSTLGLFVTANTKKIRSLKS